MAATPLVCAQRVPPDLSRRILEFFQYKLQSSKSGLQETYTDELPSELALLLTFELHKDLIRKCVAWKGML